MNRYVLGALTMGTLGLLFPLRSVYPALGPGPEIVRNGVVNAASNTPSEATGNRVARGALLAITGARLSAPGTGSIVRLAGSWGSTPLKVLSASPGRITARVPPGMVLGPAALTVTTAGNSSKPFPVNVVSSLFGIYSLNGKGWGPGRVYNLAASGARSPNSVSNPASAGRSLILTGSGLGDAPAPGVYIAGNPAKVLSVRRADSRNTEDEIAFKLPATAPEGCFVPVQVRHAGALPSNVVTISIQAGGGACHPPEYFPFAGWSVTRAGLIVLSRIVATAFTFESVVDKVEGSFVQLPAKLNPYVLLPPPGACSIEVESRGEDVTPSELVPLLTNRGNTQLLDAGPSFTIDDGRIVRKANAVRGASGAYSGDVSNYHRAGGAPTFQHFLSPVELRIKGVGGSDVGRFQFSLQGPVPFAIALPDSRLNRDRSMTVSWSGMGPDRFAIILVNFVDPSSDTRGMCYCAAAPGARTLSIPPAYFAYFPVASKTAGQSVPARGALIVASWPMHPVSFQATGLDHGFATSIFVRAARLDFQ